MSSTETPSDKEALRIALSALTLPNYKDSVIGKSNLPSGLRQDFWDFVTQLGWYQLHAHANLELRTLLVAITDALARDYTLATLIGQPSPSPKDSPSPTSAPPATAPAAETGAEDDGA